MLAWVFVVEIVVAAAVPLDARAGRIRPAQLVAPPPSQPIAGRVPLIVGDRQVRLIGLGGATADRLLARIAAQLRTAIDKVEAFWGVDWSRDISVVVAGSDDEFRTAAGGGAPSQWADIAAITVADHIDPAHRVVVGQRIVFAPGAATMSDSALRIVLTHELFHYASRADTAIDAPQWLAEGVADFVARPSAPVPAEERSRPVSLPSDFDLDTPGPQRSLAYDRAWWFARFVADTFGVPKLRAYYLAVCGGTHADPYQAGRDVLDIDPAGLLTRWQQWMVGGA
ncbi:MAG: hypothetical protein VYA67_20735 [Actinomycetota bacterium]|uniref:DUF4157 domain-containing protein n=1 Tax=Mycobacterium lentiflavum TaxID=141349 RepID=A0ABY3V694_MYCLN|nr:hypothetical protein [Mycobacterium lentiflavum]MEE3066338.1 hypothetical protein [Actinomycetota bacterium]ULP45149.1 hypothetical protein MJO58_16400 [Mycobacterium lentiflavum]